MRAHEMFKAMSPAVAHQLLGWFREEERDVYRTAISQLAAQRRLRPVFVTKKSREDQFAWLHKTLSALGAAEMADHLLQIWLLKARTGMLKEFLVALGIEHDEDGSVEDLPEELDAAKLKDAVDGLLADYPAHEVTLYLHMFNGQADGGWDTLAELLESDERLTLGA